MRPEAEGAAQEALTRALMRWGRIEDYAEPWVVATATNLPIDGVRRGQRGRPAEESTPAPAAAFVEERMDLVRALLALPRRQREVIALRFLGDLSELDVATALGLSNGTVKSHCACGVTARREQMQPVAGR